jgi:hypothetical protein
VVEHDMQFIRMISSKVTVFHEGRILIEDTWTRSRPIRGCAKSIWGIAGNERAMILEVGAALGLRPGAGAARHRPEGGRGRDARHPRPQRHGQDDAAQDAHGHRPATSGTIVFDGVDVTRLPAHERNRIGIGYVPAGARHLPQPVGARQPAHGRRRA